MMKIEIKTLMIDGHYLTRTIFNQLRRWYPRNFIQRDNKDILGQVILPRDENVLHIVWTDQNSVYVAEIPRYIDSNLNDDFIQLKSCPQIFLR